MARIRTIKPEFWTDEKIVKLRLETRLFFVGLWNFADDDGCLWYEPERLSMQIFPRDPDIQVAVLLDELIGEEMVELRENDEGNVYIRVIGFNVHQKIDHPTPSKISSKPYKKKSISFQLRRELAVRAGAKPGDENFIIKCHYCSADGCLYWPLRRNGQPGAWVYISLQIDHIHPEVKGGQATAENLVFACSRCNHSKGHRDVSVFIASTRDDSRGLSPEGKGMEGKGRDQSLTTADAVDFTVVRFPYGKHKGVHIADLPIDECQLYLKDDRLGQKIRSALKARIESKNGEMTGKQRAVLGAKA